MKVSVVASAGFCFGVNRACEKAWEKCKKEKIFLLGELIHNNDVMNEFFKKGATLIDSIDEVEKNCVCVIRAHGVTKDVISSLKKKNIQFIDLTCPYVKKIHNIVKTQNDENKKIIIYGKKQHPEVIGIASYCDDYIASMDLGEVEKRFCADDNIIIVAQTTVELDKFKEFCNNIKNIYKNVTIFDTICSATRTRQNDSVELAKSVDFMIVIGGKKSSNTMELYNKCSSVCANCVHIENVKQLYEHFNIDVSLTDDTKKTMLKNILYTNFKGVGVTAGASTPNRSIEEVITVMSDENITTSEFEKELENYSANPVHTGSRVTGTVEQITETEVRINIPGYKGVGIIPIDELTDDSSLKPCDVVKIGDELTAKVTKPNDLEGYCMLSKKSIDSVVNMDKIKKAFETQEILDGKVVSAVKGGLLVSINSARVFVPASLISLRFVQDLNVFVNNDVKLRIIDFDEKRNRATGSIKSVLQEEQKVLEDAFWKTAEVGKTYTGKVKSLTSFGAFVDLGGIDGLVHITELSWTRIKHPSDVVKEGDEITVYIKSIDEEKRKISLGYKKEDENPWTLFSSTYKLNDAVECKIVRIVPFGAFAQIIDGVDGLVHISQIANRHIAKPEDELSVGQVVTAKIIEINDETRKVSLSIRELLEEAQQNEENVESEDTVAQDIESTEE